MPRHARRGCCRNCTSVVDAQRPESPSVAGAISTGGYAISVAVERGLVAVGLRDGTVRLYDLRGTPVELASFQVGFQLSKVRFVAGRLFALDRQGKKAEVWSLDDPASPVPMGSLQERATALTLGRFRGARLYYLDGRALQVLRAEAATMP